MFCSKVYTRLQLLNNYSKLQRIKIRKESTITCKEIRIPVPWGHLAAKWWGPEDKQPILCLHGWQDNCNTFDRLIPLLTPDHSFLAFDYPGHGLSSKLPNGIFYYAFDAPILLRRLQKYFNWTKISALGHSLGANLIFAFATYFPNDIDLLIQLDGIKPLSCEPGGHIERTARYIDTFLRYDDMNISNSEPTSFTMDELCLRLHEGGRKSIDLNQCHHILNRMIRVSKSDPNKYYITRDIRTKNGNIVGWQHEDLKEYAKHVKCPLLTIHATGSKYVEDEKYFYDIVKILKNIHPDFKYYEVDAKHHVHLNEPEKVAGLINEFIIKYRTNNNTIPLHSSGRRGPDYYYY